MAESIPHIEERKKLLALTQQSDAVWKERAVALKPLEETASAVWREVLAGHEANGGKWPGTLEDHKKVQELAAPKYGPADRAVKETRASFDARLEAIRAEISAIEEAIGSKMREDHWNGEGDALCALTGLPILESDKAGPVIAAALPVTAAINKPLETEDGK